jgi:hypothetical protein
MKPQVTVEQAIDKFLIHSEGYFPDTSIASISRKLEELTVEQVATLGFYSA